MPLEDFAILTIAIQLVVGLVLSTASEDRKRGESRRFQRLEQRRIRRVGTIWE